ncbi:MAG TPA: serine/threonine-protein kinase [Polyangiaceae bacterium]|jgi:serine/threonine-protein kinase|nr:serine/threonine-protein kinase [Polyangiaceae bacterium]
MSPADKTSDTPTFERYRVTRKLRSGPITDLYRAEQVTLGRPVIIKALGRGILPASPFAAALEREARLLTELDHPNVIRVVEFVEEKETMWLVLEHVDGFSLEEILAQKRLSPVAAAAIGFEICQGLAHAHEHGIVHRDVQPANVLVSRDGWVKLVNFAAAADERLPTAPELLDGSAGFGTPEYMSPEQLLGEPEDPRSDLFSLGIVLYELITGRRPFDSSDEKARSHRTRHDPVPPLHRSTADVPASLDRAVRRCLEKMQSDRFPNALELGRALAREVEDGGFSSPIEAVAAELAKVGLAPKPEVRRDSVRMRVRLKPPTVGAALGGYLAALCLIGVGGAAIQFKSASARGERAARTGVRLELVPPNTGYLRVVADPWANVVVDGEQVETTPFGRSIPLTAGVHYVRLEHPAAPTERRTVMLSPGETVLLDVKMDVARPKRQVQTAPTVPNLTDPKTP